MPGWSSLSDMIYEITTNGKYKFSVFQKTSVNATGIVYPGWAETYSWSGIPAAGPQTGAAGTGTLIKQSVQGTGIDIGADVSPDVRSLLSVQAQALNASMVPMTAMLVDFLVYWPSLVVTGTPTVLTSMPLSRYTDGKGVMALAAVQTALGAASPSLTLTCTYNDGTSAAIASPLVANNINTPRSEILGAGGFQALPFAPLPAGKVGIKSIDSYVINSGGTTGTVCFFLVKPLMMLPIVSDAMPTERDMLTQIPSLPRIYDDAHLGFIVTSYSVIPASGPFAGALGMGWG